MKRCAWCGAAYAANPGPGRPRQYCKPSHRQRHYEARAVAEDRGIRHGELLVERSKLERLHDLLYVLEATCEDAQADTGPDADLSDYQQALTQVLAAARPLAKAYIEPKADPHG